MSIPDVLSIIALIPGKCLIVGLIAGIPVAIFCFKHGKQIPAIPAVLVVFGALTFAHWRVGILGSTVQTILNVTITVLHTIGAVLYSVGELIIGVI